MPLPRRVSIAMLRLRSIFGRSRVERELEDEMRFHLEERTRELMAQGLGATEARAAAARMFGGVEQRKEECRDARRVGWLEDLLSDTRYALRSMRRARGFTAVVVVSLALGLGANTAIFAAINAVMFRPLPLPRPDELVQLHWSSRGFPEAFVDMLEGGGGRSSGGGINTGDMFPYATWRALGDRPGSMTVVAFAADATTANVGIGGAALSARLLAVSGNYFTGLAVGAARGRLFSENDDRPDAPAAAVVSYAFWRNGMGSGSAIDRPIVINGEPFTVIGIAADTFSGLEPGLAVDVWVPLTRYASHPSRRAGNRLPYLSDSKLWWVRVAGRRSSAMPLADADARTTAAFEESIGARSTVAGDDVPRVQWTSIATGIDSLQRALGPSLRLLMALVALVLLIACANVGGLLLERATAREREMALRLSLGVRRGRLVRQLLTESAVLAITGGAAALVTTIWGYPAVMSMLSSTPLPAQMAFAVDARIMAFTVAVSLASAAMFGLAPVAAASRVQLIGTLRQRSAIDGGGRLALGKMLVAGQVAVTLMLLVAAALFARTLQQLHHAELGFTRENLLLFTVQPGLNGYDGVRLDTYYAELLRRVESIPGVTAATIARRPAVGGGAGSSGATLRGAMTTEPVTLARHEIGPHYFETLGVPIVAGRAIDDRDTRTAAHVVVINATLARQYFGNRDPLGASIEFGSTDPSHSFEVIGVAADVKYSRIRTDTPPTVYLPYQQFFSTLGSMSFLVRSTAEAGGIVPAIQHEARALDPAVPVTNVRTQLDAIDATLTAERTFAMLSTALAALALVLSCVGLYGTMRYSVRKRRSEIGIRMALGARRATVVGMVLSEALRIVSAGIVVGLAGSLAGARLINSQLYGVAAHDPWMLTAASGLLTIVAAIAVAQPARQAATVDPVIALRTD